MFLVSAALVGVAIVLLVLGMITAKLALVYIAIGVSVVSMILLGVGIFLQRELLWGKDRGRGEGEAGEPEREREPVAAGSASRTATGPGEAPATGSSVPDEPASTGEAATAGPAGTGRAVAPDAELVHVVPGRRRYHREGCASLAGRSTEELTIDEAREEGFTACTTCFPAGAAAETAESETAAATEPGAGVTDGTGEPAGPASAMAGGYSAEPVTPVSGTPVQEPAEPASADEPAPADEQAAGAGAPGGNSGAAAATAGREDAPAGESRTEAPGSNETVWVVRGVSRYHRSDCVLIRSVDEEDVDTMTQAAAEATGCTACRACHAVDEPLAG